MSESEINQPIPEDTEGQSSQEQLRPEVSEQTRRFMAATAISAVEREMHDALSAAFARHTAGEHVAGVDISYWEGITKSRTEEGYDIVEVHPMTRVNLKVGKERSEPKWPVVQPAQPLEIIRPINSSERKIRPDGMKTAVILPDMQASFRRYPDGTYEPTHDPEALSVALQLIRDIQPNDVVILGDTLDLPEMGRFRKYPEFAAASTQKTINAVHDYLCAIKANAPEDVKIALLEGNHDARMTNYLLDNAMSAFGLTKANEPEGWPALSPPALLRLDELGIEYVDAYPAGTYRIAPGVECIHGTLVRSRGSSAAALTYEPWGNRTVIFGHVHRHEQHSFYGEDGQGNMVERSAYSPGALCDVTGKVPGAKAGTKLSGKPVRAIQPWAQGIGVVHYNDEGYHVIEHVKIDTPRNHRAYYDNHLYEADASILPKSVLGTV